MHTRLARTVVAGLAAIVFLTPTVTWAQRPTKDDMRSCNEKAKSELEKTSVSASPRLGEKGAGAASEGAGTKPPRSVAMPRSEDAQLQGIDPEGEKDPAYIAEYKKCMRQAGF